MRTVLRLVKIAWVCARYRLDTLITDAPIPRFARLIMFFLPSRWLIPARAPRGERLRLALESLGPVFVKFGQMLSTRRDLLPNDIAVELAKLQDRVPPFSGTTAQKIIEHELGQSVKELFREFHVDPMASASIAQVHSAVLHDGREVVVKVIRPGIQPVIRQDVALLYMLARLVRMLWREGRRLRPVEVIREYEQTLIDELDLRKEAANGSQLRRNFEGSESLYVPEIFWEMTRTNVLVLERVYGIPVANIDALKAQNTDLKKLAERGVEIFFTQVFRDSFFHADMHPGNIFVSPGEPDNPRYIAIDFGIVGSLTTEDQNYLARNILAFFKRDYRQVAQLHIDSGWVPANTNVHAFETAIRSVCEPIFEKPLKDISFGMVLLGLFQTARRFNMQVQPQLVMLQKTLLNIEGLGRQLYPDLDLWKTGKPFLENWMRERMGVKAAYRAVKHQLPDWLEKMPQMPQLVYDSLIQVRHLDQTQRQLLENMTQSRHKQKGHRLHRLVFALVLLGVAALSGSTVGHEWLSQLPWYGWGCGIVGLWMLWRS